MFSHSSVSNFWIFTILQCKTLQIVQRTDASSQDEEREQFLVFALLKREQTDVERIQINSTSILEFYSIRHAKKYPLILHRLSWTIMKSQWKRTKSHGGSFVLVAYFNVETHNSKEEQENVREWENFWLNTLATRNDGKEDQRNFDWGQKHWYFCVINQQQMNPKPTTMTPPTTFVARDSTGAPSKLRQTSISSMIQDNSKRNDDFLLFTCSYILAWVGICMYFGGLNSEKWLWSLKRRNKLPSVWQWVLSRILGSVYCRRRFIRNVLGGPRQWHRQTKSLSSTLQCKKRTI